MSSHMLHLKLFLNKSVELFGSCTCICQEVCSVLLNKFQPPPTCYILPKPLSTGQFGSLLAIACGQRHDPQPMQLYFARLSQKKMHLCLDIWQLLKEKWLSDSRQSRGVCEKKTFRKQHAPFMFASMGSHFKLYVSLWIGQIFPKV